MISEVDKFIVERAPWKLAKSKDDNAQDLLDDTLYTAAESLRIVTALISPVIPHAAQKIWSQLGMLEPVDSVKLADLRRDPRLALHSASEDPPKDDPREWVGDAKIAGRAVEVPEADRHSEPAPRFRVDVDEVVLMRVGRPADHLVIESWHEGRGLQRRERR